MRDLIAAVGPELDPNVILPAALTVVGVLGAAAIASRASRSRPKPPVEPEPPVVTPSPLANFSGTQNEFMALVIEDNAAIRSELATVKGDVASLRAELEDARNQHGLFERAVRRYLELIASVWPGPEPMPWPDSGDFAMLERTLPRRRRATPKKQ